MLPFGRRVGAEGIRHRAPACVFHEKRFFRASWRAAFLFAAFQSADGFDVVESLVAEAAFADPVSVCYSEIAGGEGVWFWVGLPDDDGLRGGCSGSGGRNAHSRIASSQAA